MVDQERRDFLFKKAPVAATTIAGLVSILNNPQETAAASKTKRNYLRDVSSINHTTALTNNFQTSNVRGQKQFVLEEYLKDPFTFSANDGGIILGTKDKQSDRYSVEIPDAEHVKRIFKRPDLAHVVSLVGEEKLMIPTYKQICDIVSLMKDNSEDNLSDNANLRAMTDMHYDFINASLSPEEMKEIYSMIKLEVGKSALVPFKILKTNPEEGVKNECVYALMEIRNEGIKLPEPEIIEKPVDFLEQYLREHGDSEYVAMACLVFEKGETKAKKQIGWVNNSSFSRKRKHVMTLRDFYNTGQLDEQLLIQLIAKKDDAVDIMDAAQYEGVEKTKGKEGTPNWYNNEFKHRHWVPITDKAGLAVVDYHFDGNLSGVPTSKLRELVQINPKDSALNPIAGNFYLQLSTSNKLNVFSLPQNYKTK